MVGLAGLVGAGRSEVARAVFGIDRYDAGDVMVDGRRLAPGLGRSGRDGGRRTGSRRPTARGSGVADVGRRQHFAGRAQAPATWRTWCRHGRERELVDEQMAHLQVKAASPDVAAATLSGGNQQKLVIGKWLASRPRVLILDEPTRGVDVGAKAQVHHLIRQLAAEGIATLMISSELPELLAMSDRILVMREGRLVGELAGGTAQQADVLQLALPDGQRPTASTRSDGPMTGRCHIRWPY